MKKILIIADGILAKHFLERVMATKGSDNHYTVVAYRAKTLPESRSEDFTFHDFDPTSFEKLSVVMNKEFYQVMILMSKEIDAVTSYRNIRVLNRGVQVVMMDRWGFDNEDDPNLVTLNSREILSSRFADYLPDVPVIAQNVGLGAGEVMEIHVPIGSSYVYRHIASIQQKKWRIVAIYRNNALIMARPTLMIQPNDVLLTIGDPNVLNNVFKSIKQALGQFPSPFGNNIYTLVDMKMMREDEVETIINDAMLLHSKLNSTRLQVKVINPTYCKVFEKIKSYANRHTNVMIDYFNTNAAKALREDTAELDVGLIVVNTKFFDTYKHILHRAKLPVFKIGMWGFSSLERGVILGGDSEEIEKESSVILDLCSQLELEVSLYDFDPDRQNQKSSIVEHFENLSRLFGKEVEIIQDDERNPLITLQGRKDLLQFIPFHEKLLESNLFAIFTTDMEKLSYKLKKNYQVFIPTSS